MAERTIPATPQSSDLIIDPFEHFASEEFYRNLNRQLVRSIGLEAGYRVGEFGCGPGNVTLLIAEEIGPGGEIFASDFSRIALLAAKKNLFNVETPTHLVQVRAEDFAKFFPDLENKLDAVICGNAVHNFEDKSAFFLGANFCLKRERQLAFNTTFYKGSVDDEVLETFYKPWIGKALRTALKDSRKDDLSSKKSTNKRTAASPENQLTMEEYEKLLREAGFGNIQVEIQEVELSISAFLNISLDREFQIGALSDRIPYEIARDSLQESVRVQFKEGGREFYPRKWMRVIAVKKSERALESAV